MWPRVGHQATFGTVGSAGPGQSGDRTPAVARKHESVTFSVVCPVFNGEDTIGRAVDSVLSQQHAAWELLVVDDCSADGTAALVQSYCRRDSRIRYLKSAENLGPGAARNHGLRLASGNAIAFLDCDDEFYSDFLSTAAAFLSVGDVLVFGYDYVDDDNPEIRGSWDPSLLRAVLFSTNVSTPLGVVHRRLAPGTHPGFGEALWCLEDWDYWKGLARLGMEFLYIPRRSGLYHIRKGSRSRAPRLTNPQAAGAASNRLSCPSLYGTRELRRRRGTRVLLACSSLHLGEVSHRGDFLEDLTAIMHGTSVDLHMYAYDVSYDPANDWFVRHLRELCVDRQTALHDCDGFKGVNLFTKYNGTPVTVFRNYERSPYVLSEGDVAALLKFYYTYLRRLRPNVFLTLSCDPATDPVGYAMLLLAKQMDVTVVNFIGGAVVTRIEQHLLHSDFCVSSSSFHRRHHWESLGLNCTVLPPPVRRSRVSCCRGRRVFAAYFYPHPLTGGNLFFSIVALAHKRRIRIPFLVVESPHLAAWRRNIDVDLGQCEDCCTVLRPHDIRKVWEHVRLLINPVYGLSQPIGLFVESLLNSVPVLTFDGEAAREVLGDGGVYVAPPPGFRRSPWGVPPDEDVELWLDRIVELMEGEGAYTSHLRGCEDRAGDFAEPKIRELYERFFSSVFPQPGPPLASSRAGPISPEPAS